MSNSRRLRRSLKASREARELRPRYPYTAPSLGTVRTWMKQLEADGDIEPKGVQRTGMPGRPPMAYGLMKQGRERNLTAGQIRDMITRAVHDRKPGRVAHLLWLLSAKDPDEARRVAARLGIVPEATGAES